MRDDAVGRRPWDLLVVGAGTAGLVGAQTAASVGARVLLVERARFGGDCLWTGCVPSKALLAAGHAAADARAAARYGVRAGGITIDAPAVLAHVRRAIATIEPVDSPDAVRRSGARVTTGTVRFTGPSSAQVDGRAVRFRHALVATGSEPALPDLPGLRGVEPLTTDSFWELRDLPDAMAVLGGGTTGCELAQALARLGVDVSLVESSDRLLRGEDPDASAAVTAALRRDGVRVHLSATPVSAEGGAASTGRLLLQGGDTVGFDRLLVATGRRPRTDELDLAAAGVSVGADGWVVVDDTLRTTNPRIFAAGDVTGHPQYTHLAGVHASIAVANAVLGLRRTVDLSAVPRVTCTSPEIAAVGEPTGVEVPGRKLLTERLTAADRAIAEQSTDGFTRLVVDDRHRIRGATVVGPRAGEALAELTLAVSQGLTTRNLTGSIHPYPTYADPQWNAAIGDVRRRLTRPAARAVIGALLLARRASAGLRR